MKRVQLKKKQILTTAFYNTLVVVIVYYVSMGSPFSVVSFAITSACVLNMTSKYDNFMRHTFFWLFGSFSGIFLGLLSFALFPQYLWSYALFVSFLLFTMNYFSIADEGYGDAYIMGTFSFFTLKHSELALLNSAETLYFALQRAEEVSLAVLVGAAVRYALPHPDNFSILKEKADALLKYQKQFFATVFSEQKLPSKKQNQRELFSALIERYRFGIMENSTVKMNAVSIRSSMYYFKQLVFTLENLYALSHYVGTSKQMFSNEQTVKENTLMLFDAAASSTKRVDTLQCIAAEMNNDLKPDERSSLFLRIYQNYLQQIQHALRNIALNNRGINGDKNYEGVKEHVLKLPGRLIFFDRKALITSVRLVFIFWMGLFTHLAIWGSYSSAFMMVTVIAFLSVRTFQYNPLKPFLSFNFGMAIGAVFYCYVLVYYNTWYTLGLFIFLYGMMIYTLFYNSPVDTFFGFFSILLIGIINHQHYHIDLFFNYWAEYNIILCFVVLSKYFPLSLREADSMLNFRRLFYRYASVRLRLHYKKITRGLTWYEKVYYDYHYNHMRLVLGKFAEVLKHFDDGYYSAVRKENIEALLESFNTYYLLVADIEASDRLLGSQGILFFVKKLETLKQRISLEFKALSEGRAYKTRSIR